MPDNYPKPQSQTPTSQPQAQKSAPSSSQAYVSSYSQPYSQHYSQKLPPFRLYKANKTNSGSAFSLDLNAEKEAIFIDVSKQIGELKFDWANKITMKLSTTDIGKMLAVLMGKAKFAKLFHDPSKGQYESSKDTKNTVLEFNKGVQYGYTLKASQQSVSGALDSILVPISDDEAEVIRVLLEAAIKRIYGW